MGKKSDKKIKSDRLNALRKQYDSFIEEDKKRKERNDFILQRLDKICYSVPAGLQFRPKTIYCEYPQPGYGQPSYNRFDYRPDKMKLNDDVIHSNHHRAQVNLQLDIPRQFDDISILREISKKYILIPKSQTAMFNNYMATNPVPQENKPVRLPPEPQSNVVDNNDWRSKYDILEQLKNKEHEEDINKPTKEEMVPLKTQFTKAEPDSSPKNNFNDNVIQNIKSDMLAKYKAELPEKDLPDHKFNTGNEFESINDLKNSNIVPEECVTNIEQPSKVIESNGNFNPAMDEPAVTESGIYNNPGLEQTVNNGNDFVRTDYANHNVPATEEVSYQPPQEQINTHYEENNAQEQPEHLDMNQTNNLYQLDNVYQDYANEYEQHEPVVQPTQYQENYPNEYEQHEPVVETNQYQENEIKDVENEYSPLPVTTPSETLHEPSATPEVINVNKVDDNVEYPNGNMNVQDFTPTVNIELQDGVNINEYDATNQELTLKSNETEALPINAPNINQQQLHAENLANNSGIEAFDTEQKDTLYTYDQGGAGETYDPEFVPNQEYQENADYNYYENEQQDAYPAATNEHEGSSEHYGPNYDQQFVSNYDEFVQQQDPNVQYEEQQHTQQYEQQPTVEYQQQDPNEQYEEQQHTQQYEQQPTVEYQQPDQYQQMDQGYEQYNYEQENQNAVAHVEQELDRENGFIEPNPEVMKVAKEAK